MVGAIHEALRSAGIDGRILVVDDSSPDGTGTLADELAARHAFVEVLHRPRKEGLGPAYLAGFRHALAAGADLVAEIDCDFSHDPADLPRLVAAATDADLVLGSRYVPGGGTRNWGLLRRLVSRGGCLYAQAVLASPIRDLTGGFKCFRRSAIEALPLDRIESRGYAFQVETTYRVARAGLRVTEVPIVFVDRRAGQSKMTRSIMAEALVRLPKLRWLALRGRL
ncbi:MAG: polyprenol monophosphomannose synthase [Gaiellales bacterium]